MNMMPACSGPTAVAWSNLPRSQNASLSILMGGTAKPILIITAAILFQNLSKIS